MPSAAHDSPNDAIPLQKYSGDVGYVESVLNGEAGIICRNRWYICRNWEEYCKYPDEYGTEKGNHRVKRRKSGEESSWEMMDIGRTTRR